jgi:hypothetical protein
MAFQNVALKSDKFDVIVEHSSCYMFLGLSVSLNNMFCYRGSLTVDS